MRELIDRAALIAEYDRVHVGPPGGARKLMEDAPTIEERKKGEWINVTNDESLEEEYECSVCGYELFYSNPTKFCPNCGAKMMSEQIHELETELRDYENKGDDY